MIVSLFFLSSNVKMTDPIKMVLAQKSQHFCVYQEVLAKNPIFLISQPMKKQSSL